MGILLQVMGQVIIITEDIHKILTALPDLITFLPLLGIEILGT